ncbi:hypothetical protein Fmac_013864 [Flemingia macrophylla]|uniref:Uncharacterized protein n=1 Tax=Flemingia macrophylla TaxID=520843 RepID=A0ABD1MA24_9FABA
MKGHISLPTAVLLQTYAIENEKELFLVRVERVFVSLLFRIFCFDCSKRCQG